MMRLFVKVLLSLLLFLNETRADDHLCEPISESLKHSQFSTLTCSSQQLGSIAVGSVCVIKCRFKNLLSQHFCFKSGWDKVPDDQQCHTKCFHPDQIYDKLSWSCSSTDSFETGDTCQASCRQDDAFQNLTIQCDASGSWRQIQGPDCECAKETSQFHGISWNCTTDTTYSSRVCRGHCNHNKTPQFQIQCGYDGDWKFVGPSGPPHCHCQDPDQVYQDIVWKCDSTGSMEPGTQCHGACSHHKSNSIFGIECQNDGTWITLESFPEVSVDGNCGCFQQLQSHASKSGQCHGRWHCINNVHCHLKCDPGYQPWPTNFIYCPDLGPSAKGLVDIPWCESELPVALVVAGIGEDGQALDDIEVYDPLDVHGVMDGKRCLVPNLPIPMSNSIGVWFDGHVTVCGSQGVQFETRCFTLASNISWLEVPSLVEGLFSSHIEDHGHLLFIGGQSVQGDALNTIKDFNGFNHTLNHLDEVVPIAVTKHCSVLTFNSSNQVSNLVIIGGESPSANWEVENCLMSRLGEDSDHWQPCPTTGSKIISPSCLNISPFSDPSDESIIILVNTNDTRIRFASVRHDTDSFTWTPGPFDMALAREGPGLAQLGHHIFIFGGNTPTVEQLGLDEPHQISTLPRNVTKIRRYPSVVAVPRSFCD